MPSSRAKHDTDLTRMIPIVGRGILADETRGEPPVKATYAVVDEASLSVALEDGRRIMVPLAWYPRLVHASPAERNDWRLAMGARVILWKALGLGVSIKALLEGVKADESAASLKKWLAERAAASKRKTA